MCIRSYSKRRAQRDDRTRLIRIGSRIGFITRSFAVRSFECPAERNLGDRGSRLRLGRGAMIRLAGRERTRLIGIEKIPILLRQLARQRARTARGTLIESVLGETRDAKHHRRYPFRSYEGYSASKPALRGSISNSRAMYVGERASPRA